MGRHWPCYFLFVLHPQKSQSPGQKYGKCFLSRREKIHREVDPPITKKLVKRENLENAMNALKKILQLSSLKKYIVILGEHGTGKKKQAWFKKYHLESP